MHRSSHYLQAMIWLNLSDLMVLQSQITLPELETGLDMRLGDLKYRGSTISDVNSSSYSPPILLGLIGHALAESTFR